MNDDWAALLDDDEQITWQGRPDARLHFAWAVSIIPIMNIFGILFLLVPLRSPSEQGTLFWLYGVVPCVFGLYALIGIHFWKADLYRNTYYALTNMRACIHRTTWRKRTVTAFNIRPFSPRVLVDGPTQSVLFGNSNQNRKFGRLENAIRFDYIQDGRNVMTLLRKVQRGLA